MKFPSAVAWDMSMRWSRPGRWRSGRDICGTETNERLRRLCIVVHIRWETEPCIYSVHPEMSSLGCSRVTSWKLLVLNGWDSNAAVENASPGVHVPQFFHFLRKHALSVGSGFRVSLFRKLPMLYTSLKGLLFNFDFYNWWTSLPKTLVWGMTSF